MARPQHTPPLAHLEDAVTVLFCLVDEAYALLNPRAKSYESLKRLSDYEVDALALFQQLRGIESERSFLRDAGRFFSRLSPEVVRPHPLLIEPAGEVAQALFGTSEAGDPPRARRRAGDPDRRLD